MHYFGGKHRIAKHIVKYLEEHRGSTIYYFEPFVGGASIVSKMGGARYASDMNGYLIDLYKALQEGWVPPTIITEDQYAYIRDNKDECRPLTGFVGIGCSYSGKWFGGYARNKRGDNFCMAAHNSLMGSRESIMGVVFKPVDYKECHPKNALVYCDPPYAGTTGYGATGGFDTNEFWDVMREWSKTNTVVVSEYAAPEDFECVLEIPTKLEIRNRSGERESRIERLFSWRSK